MTQMNQNLELFYNWCLINRLSINTTKTKVLPYYSAYRNNFLEGYVIKINNKVLECVSVYTYLGIRLDSHLSMKNHLDHLYRASLHILYSLACIRKYVDTNTAILIFKAHILSKLEYGSALCIGANNSYLDRLQKLVNQSLRFCLHGARDANVVGMHLDAKVLPLKIRRNIALMKLMFGRIIAEGVKMPRENRRVTTRGSKYAKLDIRFLKRKYSEKVLPIRVQHVGWPYQTSSNYVVPWRSSLNLSGTGTYKSLFSVGLFRTCMVRVY